MIYDFVFVILYEVVSFFLTIFLVFTFNFIFSN